MAYSSRDKVYKAIKTYQEKHGYSPTIRELCDLTGLRSTSTIHQHIQNLIIDGRLSKKDASPRTVKTVNQFLDIEKIRVLELRNKQPYRIEVNGLTYQLEEQEEN